MTCLGNMIVVHMSGEYNLLVLAYACFRVLLWSKFIVFLVFCLSSLVVSGDFKIMANSFLGHEVCETNIRYC